MTHHSLFIHFYSGNTLPSKIRQGEVVSLVAVGGGRTLCESCSYQPPSVQFPRHSCTQRMTSCCCLLLLFTKLCPSLCNPMDCSPPGFSVYGIFQARILERVAIPFSSGSSRSRDWTHISCQCLAGRFFTTEPPVDGNKWQMNPILLWTKFP